VRDALPGDFLLRPVSICACAILAFNDHVLKARFGSVVTGKLSDAAGLVFVPFLVLALVELLRARFVARWTFTRWELAASLAVVGAALIAAKLVVPVAHVFGDLGGAARFPVDGRFTAVGISHDPTDLEVLPALGITWWEGLVVIRKRVVCKQRSCA